MPLQVFADESGGKGQGRFFAMAGLLGHSEDWGLFSADWGACLRQSPAIRRFKMKDAASCTGEFHGWCGKDRDAKLLALVRIINRYAKSVTYSVIDLEAHAKSWAVTCPKPMNDPYFYPFLNIMTSTCLDLWDHAWREPFEAIFDENLIIGKRARSWYSLMVHVVHHQEPEASALMPVDPIFRSDDEALPLQAADLYAWCFRRGTQDADSMQFTWLLDELRSVKANQYSQFYDAPRMEQVQKKSDEFFNSGKAKTLLAQYYKNG
jgi:hypothetical protein